MSPDASAPDPVPHEYVDAAISVAGLETPAHEQALHDALSQFDGIRKLTISQGNIAVEYDPLRVTKARISEAIRAAGFQVNEVESGLASPITDALHEDE